MQMILGVIEGQIRGGYFPDCILDPSVIDPTPQFYTRGKMRVAGTPHHGVTARGARLITGVSEHNFACLLSFCSSLENVYMLLSETREQNFHDSDIM